MRKAIAAAGITLAAVASAAVAAAPASAASAGPDTSITEQITTYWNTPSSPDADTACNNRGKADERSGVAFNYWCTPTERQVNNGTWQTGDVLYESFLVG